MCNSRVWYTPIPTEEIQRQKWLEAKTQPEVVLEQGLEY